MSHSSLRIALVSEHASPLAEVGSVDAGGQNVYVREVAHHLAASGHQVDVFTRRDHDDLETVVDVEPGIRVVHVEAGPSRHIPKEELLAHMPAFAQWVREWIGGSRYDVAHANFFMSGLVTRDLGRWLGIPYVVTFHALGAVRTLHQKGADRFPADRVALEQAVIDEAAAVVAECPQDEADLVRWYDLPRDKLVTIPCGVDVDVFRPIGRSLARARRGWSPDEWVILHVGRMVPRKGVDTVVEAMAELRDRGVDDVRLVVVGGCSEDPSDDAEVQRLADLAHRLGVDGMITFEGRVAHERLPQFYGAADVFVTTPWYEPFGITPLEAMASGLPVIGSNVGGVKFTVRDGETGYLVPPKDAASVADALLELKDHPKVAEALSSNARRRVRDLFTWSGVAESLDALYQRVIDHDLSGDDRTQVSITARNLTDLEAVLARSRELDAAASRAARLVIDSLRSGGTLLVAGNGGSASQAQHLAAELMGRFMLGERPALRAVALTADVAVITAWANDVGFDDVFARQVDGLGRAGDVLVGLSTSGNSANVLAAFDAAKRKGMKTVALTGGDGGALADAADIAVVVPTRSTQRIQEIHLCLIHSLSELIEAGMATTERVDERPAARTALGSVG